MSLPMAGGWNWMSFKVPPNPNHSVILRFYDLYAKIHPALPGLNWAKLVTIATLSRENFSLAAQINVICLRDENCIVSLFTCF